MRLDVEVLARRISSVPELVEFIDALAADAVENSSAWENIQIPDMLESIAAWLRDEVLDGARRPAPDDPESLRFFARLLLAGKHYE
jgi:hypothetical protein